MGDFLYDSVPLTGSVVGLPDGKSSVFVGVFVLFLIALYFFVMKSRKDSGKEK